MTPNAELDLVLERRIAFPPDRIWRAYTDPERLKRWWVPRPWSLAEADLDVRPGGRFDTVMRGPDGEEHASRGCFLEVRTDRLLVFTDAMTEGWRPAKQPFMTGRIEMTPDGDGTFYRAIALHADPETKTRHEEMGFAQGWGTALDQLVELLSGTD